MRVIPTYALIGSVSYTDASNFQGASSLTTQYAQWSMNGGASTVNIATVSLSSGNYLTYSAEL